MPTIDLSSPPPREPGLLEALPRRVTLTLPELRLLAERAGGAPLPFDTVTPGGTHPLDGRLGASRSSVEDEAYLAALATLHDPQESLERRGLLADDRGVLGAIGLLASPRTAVDLDVTAGHARARAWHRSAGEAMAGLATVDGVVFELVWGGSGQWADELSRVAVVPEDLELSTSQVPALVTLPYSLADAAVEAVQTGRDDLLPVLAAQYDGNVLTIGDKPLSTTDATAVLAALVREARGRLRALVTEVGVTEADRSGAPEPRSIGVVSWTLLADGWHAVRPRAGAGERVEVCAVQPADLAAELAPVLAEVAR